MARFTIELPTELGGPGDQPGVNGATRRGAARDCQDCGDLDAATRGFVAWVECWAGA